MGAAPPATHSSLILDTLKAKKLERIPQDWPAPLQGVKPDDVERELAQPIAPFSLRRAMAFLSPAAEKYLEPMAQAARNLTLQRFGRTMQMYVPLYISNYCVNRCRYCAFNSKKGIVRRRLTIEEAVIEGKALVKQGFRDLLLVSGEDREYVTVPFLCELITRLREDFASISLEIYQLQESEYRALCAAGADGVTLYQESYDRDTYSRFHPPGPKASYEKRLSATEAIARAGMRRLGIGALLGLCDWRFETLALALHARTLMQHFWKSKVSFSFPRIRAAEGVELDLPAPVSDRDLVQMILALRLCFPDAGLVLSTREPPGLRGHLLRLGITQISAGSRTTPGGYAAESTAGAQFSVVDCRAAAEVAAFIEAQGYEPVWKDWDQGF